MMTMPQLSVIVPAYNARETLKRCLDSILGQSFRDLELIVVDDGSTDETPRICDEYAAADERVRVLHQPNGGVSRARNAGIDAARGERLAFVDADDHLLPEAYETMLRALEETGAETVLCNFLAEAPDGTLSEYGAHVPGGFYDAGAARELIVHSLLCDRLQASFNGFIWCYLFDLAKVRAAGLRFSGAYLEDEIFLIDYFGGGSSLAVVDEALYRYCLNPASVTRRYLPGYSETFRRSFAAKRELVRKHGLSVTPDWEYTTLWAGLLIAVGNEFAPGNPAGFGGKVKGLKAICREPDYARAIREHKPTGMGRNKTLVAALVRARAYGLLAALYAVKNRNRG